MSIHTVDTAATAEALRERAEARAATKAEHEAKRAADAPSTESVAAAIATQLEAEHLWPLAGAVGSDVFYARISADKAGDAHGVINQVTRAYRAGGRFMPDPLTGAPAIIDNDLSASRYARRKRPGFERLTALLDTGTVTAVHAGALDRLFRKLSDLERWRDLAERHPFTLHVEGLAPMDLRNGDQYAWLCLLVTMAAKSSDDTSYRLRKHNDAKVAAGKPSNGRVPFGLVRDASGTVVLDPVAAPLVQAAAERIVSGEATFSSVAREWNAADVPTLRGAGSWKASLVRQLLDRPSMVGDLVHRGEVVATDAWPAVLDRATYGAIRRMVVENKRYEAPRRRRPLSSLFRCGECGTTLQTNRDTWRCATSFGGCGRVSINRSRANAVVLAFVFDEYDRWLAHRPATDHTNDEMVAALAEMERLQAKQDELDAMWEADDVDTPTHKRLTAKLAPKLRAAESALVNLRQRRTSVRTDFDVPVAEAYRSDEMTDEERRTFVRGFVDHVVVGRSDVSGWAARDEATVAARLTIHDGPLVVDRVVAA